MKYGCTVGTTCRQRSWFSAVYVCDGTGALDKDRTHETSNRGNPHRGRSMTCMVLTLDRAAKGGYGPMVTEKCYKSLTPL